MANLSQSVADILSDHVTLQVACLDRMYLNVYIPHLQYPTGVVGFLKDQRSARFASTALAAPMTRAFVAAIERYSEQEHVPVVAFQKKQRKDDVATAYRRRFTEEEGLLFIGKAQEKATVCRTEPRRNAAGIKYPWIVQSTAMVNQYYFYAIDSDFGPFFLKFCSYFPYNAKLCINGHEYLKRQLVKQGIPFEPLDNGILSCADPARMQAIADDLGPQQIHGLLHKWFARLPHPFTNADHDAGYTYDISVLQAECAVTQVVDRPLTGRVFFEQVIRENLDLGRPQQVHLIFQRRMNRRTPGPFRTRILTDGVVPSLHVTYKRTELKQYFKEGRALRTEVTFNNPRDIGIGKRLHNLPALRKAGFAIAVRMAEVERVSHDCAIGEQALDHLTQPLEADGQRVSPLRFDDPRVQAILSALVMFCLLPCGFSNKEMRTYLAPLLGWDPSRMTQGKMTYDLRRLRLHGLIERRPHSHRYHVTDTGLRVAMLFTRTYRRVLRPGLSCILPQAPPGNAKLRTLLDSAIAGIDAYIDKEHLAA
jgi:hypothetical protein